MVWPKHLREKKKLFVTSAILTVITVLVTSNSLSSLPNSLTSTVSVSKLTSLSEDKYTNYRERLNKHAEIKCIGAAKKQAEDIFCLERPKTLRNYKSPCWKEGNKTIRCLPYFHLGTSKCGSTDLFYRIKQHPDVSSCTHCTGNKETMYWARRRYGLSGKLWDRPMESFSQYIKMFDAAAKRIEEQSTDDYHYGVIGDGSPMDFWDFRGWTKIPQNKGLSEPRVLTPHLMRHMYRDFRMILILRNPVDRLYSGYYFLHQGDSPESFHRDVVRSIDMMKECLRDNSTADCFYSYDMYFKLPTRVHIGCYAVYLKVWFSVYPRENFHILRTEDYRDAPAKTLLKVFDFLKLRSLDAAKIKNITKEERKNVTPSKRKAPSMFNRTRVLLTDFYAQYNAELARLLKDERFLWEMKL